jgi:hypothetical protein
MSQTTGGKGGALDGRLFPLRVLTGALGLNLSVAPPFIARIPRARARQPSAPTNANTIQSNTISNQPYYFDTLYCLTVVTGTRARALASRTVSVGGRPCDRSWSRWPSAASPGASEPENGGRSPPPPAMKAASAPPISCRQPAWSSAQAHSLSRKIVNMRARSLRSLWARSLARNGAYRVISNEANHLHPPAGHAFRPPPVSVPTAKRTELTLGGSQLRLPVGRAVRTVQ